MDVNQLPDNCQQINNQQVDCSISLFPHIAAETSTLTIDLTTNQHGQLTTTAILSNSNNQDDDLSDNKNIWIGYSTEKLNKPAQFGNTQAIVAHNPDQQNGSDLTIAYLPSSGHGYGRTYLNNGNGVLSLPNDNRYFISAVLDGYALTVMNNDDPTSASELFSHNIASSLYLMKAGALLEASTRTGVENARIPANTLFYSSIDPYLQKNSSSGLGKPRKIIFEDIDSDQGENANTGYEHIYISRDNNGAHLLYYSYPDFTTVNRPSIQLTTGTTYDGIFADLNNDNRLDIVLAKNGTNMFWLAENAAIASRFPNQVGLGSALLSRAIAAIDVDRDGDSDLIFADQVQLNNLPSEQLSIYLNDGAANFSKSSQIILTSEVDQLLVADLYGDGNDVLIVSQLDQLSLYKSSAQGLVYSPLSIEIKAPLVLADFDQDGLMDIAGDRIYLNTEITEPLPIVISSPPILEPDPIITTPYSQSIGSGSFQGYLGIASLLILITIVLVRVKKSNHSKEEIDTNE
ncbi:FG-GAP repeat domain-containing protein [Pelagibaculum spongiae]|uniref:FG-GAP repeat domain-containing protein n=1 Tax=Pelagibaculum spongiae TaxID=2080658 RepID=UPI001314CFCE|nr:VCBS repeat-containing protein [Pelagibaculum spongiae]